MNDMDVSVKLTYVASPFFEFAKTIARVEGMDLIGLDCSNAVWRANYRNERNEINVLEAKWVQ